MRRYMSLQSVRALIRTRYQTASPVSSPASARIPTQPRPTKRQSMSATDGEGHGRAAGCWLHGRLPMEPSAGRSCGPGPSPCMDRGDKQTASPASPSASALRAPTLRRRSNRAPLRIHRKRREPGPRIPLLAPRMTGADHGSGMGARDEP